MLELEDEVDGLEESIRISFSTRYQHARHRENQMGDGEEDVARQSD